MSTAVISSLYNSLKDVQVMVFIGFGCLYAYLRQHSVTSVGLNFILGAFTVEFSLIALTFWTWVFEDKWSKQEINLPVMILAVYTGATVLISLGGTIGKLSLPQYMLMVVLETIFCVLNNRLGDIKLYTVDLGGSMNIHTFGAFFGVAMTWVMFHGDKAKMQTKEKSDKISKTISFIGTIFLWLYWPSFNTANTLSTPSHAKHRGLINTYLSILGSCMGAFMVSLFVKKGKMNIKDILHASVAGGVIIGGCSTLIIYPVVAIIVGFLGGVVSTICYEFLTPCLQNKGNLFDAAGILSLHGIPGFIGGALTAIFISDMNLKDWGPEYLTVYVKNTRSPSKQAGMQVAALFITLGISVVSGVITGLILNTKCMFPIKNYFDDREYWDVEEEEIFDEKKKMIAKPNNGTRRETERNFN